MNRPWPIARLVALLLLLLSLAGGCDDDAQNAAAPATPAEPTLELDMKPLTPLLPNRPTHATVDRLGNVYWVQETDRGDDAMFVIGEGGIPRATQLSVQTIASLLGVGDGARGNIHGIAAAAGPGGDIYFYFIGRAGRSTIACIGTFTPKTEKVRVLADTEAVAAATGMGRSLALARGSVVSAGGSVWIWLRHTDNWAMFHIDPTKLPTTGPARLTRVFERVLFEGKPLELTREELEISGAPGGGIFLLDVPHAQLLKITPDGKAELVRSLIGLPSVLSTPSVDAEQNLVLFAANADLIGIKAGDPTAPRIKATFPALLIFKRDRVVTIERDHMNVYPGFAVFGTRLRQLVPHDVEKGWISYDAGSGELLRIKVTENL